MWLCKWLDLWGFPKLKEFRDKSIIDVSTPCLKSEMMFGLTNRWILCHLGQLEDWIFCVSLATPTCNGWRNVLSHICQRIGHHFKRSVDTLIGLKQSARGTLLLMNHLLNQIFKIIITRKCSLFYIWVWVLFVFMHL